ncbi:hypothetical protein CR513_31183, partial [Mucuna pruriens]
LEQFWSRYKLRCFLVNLVIPHHYLSNQARAVDEVNPTQSEWEQQDSLLFTWLCSHSLTQFFYECGKKFTNSSTYRQLRSELKTITEGKRSIVKYFARIQATIDVLLSIRDLVSNCDHLDVVLDDGLLEEYNALAAIIQYCIEPCDILEVESTFLVHEAKLEKNKCLVAPLSINIAHIPSTRDQLAQD